jgi:YVTN family beta-propeller protein
MPPSSLRFMAGGIVVATLCAAGLGGHQWSLAHVAYYTGAPARSTNCVPCHLWRHGGSIADRILRPRYRTPLNLAVSPDGRWIYVTAEEDGSLLVLDTRERRLEAVIPIGGRPQGVVLGHAGDRAYVSERDGDVVAVVDLAQRRVIDRRPAGFGPAGLALAADGARLVVADALGGDLSLLDTDGTGEAVHLAAGDYPYAVAASPDGGRVVVTSLLSALVEPGRPPASEVTVVDATARRVTARVRLRGAHLLEDAAFTPAGDLVLLPLVRPKNLLPALQVENGWMMTNGLGVLDLRHGRTAQLPLDDPEEFYADPAGIAITPDGAYAFVSHSGVDRVSVVDLAAVRALLDGATQDELDALANRLGTSRRYVVGRIETASNPRGLAVSPDGRWVYVAERLNDTVGILDARRHVRVGAIDLQGPRHESVLRRGEKVFNSARATLQHQFSCRSCHPENHVDRLQYDFEPDGLGRNLVDNRSLLGIDGTAPFKWNGKNTSLYMQCGIRFARFLTRSQPFATDDLAALAAFITSLRPPRNRLDSAAGGLTAAQRRGKSIFFRDARRDGTPIPAVNRCATCHPPGHYTDLRRSDVGTTSPEDSDTAFDTPQLTNVVMTAPYLHDGKARTLEEIWTVYGAADRHGVTSDLGKQGLNDLIEYLKSL